VTVIAGTGTSKIARRRPASMRLQMNHSSISLPEHRRRPCRSRFEDRDRELRCERWLRRDSIPWKSIDLNQSRVSVETHTAAQ
jgi:hypothetical protein